jgi:DNA-binding response OmpR family regulator
MRILIVDDDCALVEQLQKSLENQRYIVESAMDGEEALDKVFETPYDLIILDIMMPKMDGLTVLEQLRKAGGIDTAVLVLSAKGDVIDKVKALDLGADDYLAKPFSLNELLARVRALFRRSGNHSQPVLQAFDLQLDTVSREVTKGGKPVDLTSREFTILEFLLYNKNRAVSRFNLAEHVWGDNYDPFSMSNFIDVHIKNLRHKLGDCHQDRIIRTIRGVGYIIKDSTG